jgi:hypothetical protein
MGLSSMIPEKARKFPFVALGAGLGIYADLLVRFACGERGCRNENINWAAR